jgi:RNA polymerase sigma factor (sigma-70 family)
MMAAMLLSSAMTGRAEAASTPSTSAESSVRAVADIARYCQTCWRNARLPADRWSDCTQQVFVRLLERVEINRWPQLLQSEEQDKREFLRAIDAVKKRTQRARRWSELSNDQADCRQTTSNRDQWEVVNHIAEKVLSPRQKQIIELSATGWAIPEIAQELGTTPERVSDEKYKAIMKLRSNLNPES